MDSFYAKLESLANLAYVRPPSTKEPAAETDPAAGVASHTPQSADGFSPTPVQASACTPSSPRELPSASDSNGDTSEPGAGETPSPRRLKSQELVTAAAGLLTPRPALPSPMQGKEEYVAEPKKASPDAAPAQNLEDLLAQLDAFAFRAPPTPPRAEEPFKRRRGVASG